MAHSGEPSALTVLTGEINTRTLGLSKRYCADLWSGFSL
jgi:hypothetical protein